MADAKARPESRNTRVIPDDDDDARLDKRRKMAVIM